MYTEMSEDPFLAGELAAAMVRGMVGTSTTTTNPTFFSESNLNNNHTVAPLLKHFAAYSVPEGGHNIAPTFVGRRELRTTFLEPFRKAIAAGAQGIMSSYNEIDGVPTSGDQWLLTEILVNIALLFARLQVQNSPDTPSLVRCLDFLTEKRI